MVGLGILEVGIISIAAIYLYSLINRKSNIQYIELDQQQYDRLQGTLVVNNIIPNRGPDMIPPRYEESFHNQNQNQNQNQNEEYNLDETQDNIPAYSETPRDNSNNDFESLDLAM